MDDTEETKLRPIVTGWLAAMGLARTAKKDFQENADECLNFFCKSSNWLWSEQNKNKFWAGKVSPKFKMTVNKAFEMVALFGPMLYHNNPVRTVTPRKQMQFPPEMYGILPEFLQFNDANQQYQQMMQMGPPQPGMVPPPPPVPPPSLQDPMTMQQQQQAFAMYQQMQQATQQAQLEDSARADLMSAYLNYTPNEMPGGGLETHAKKAITEALLTGRGVLWTAPHSMPDGGSQIVMSEYDSVKNLLIDPDATSIEDAKWVARICTHPVWQVEQDYGLPAGSLEGKGSAESGTQQGLSAGDSTSDLDRKRGKMNDLLTYYKIYSRMGCGARMAGVDKDLDQGEEMEAVFGDYCYLVIAEGVKYPLNLPPHLLTEDMDVGQMLAWPVPYYADERWPCTVLDFYCEPNNAWPVSPLAPGLGPLKFINVMMSALANKIWTTQRTFVGVLKAAAKELKETLLKGEDLAVIELESDLGSDINKIVQFLQAPNVQQDAWHVIEAAMDIFNKVTGMNELLYGMNPEGTQSRTAADAQAKQQGMNIRPDYMAKTTETFMTEVTRREAMCARFFLAAEDIEPVLGQQAAMVWQNLVLSQDVNKVVREMEYRVEAGSVRKPNKDRQIANANQAVGQIFPPLFQYGMQTGNVGPANALLDQFAKAIDWEGGSLAMSSPPPPPPPPAGPPPEQKAA